MFRISRIQYNAGTGKSKKLVQEDLFINNADQLPKGICNVLLRLNKDENGKAIITEAPSGTKQYMLSVPEKGGMFCSVSISAMKALIAMKQVREVGQDIWVKLDIKSLYPTPADFNSAKPVTKL